MTPERRLDRLESIVKLMIKAGRRERKETREKINALIDAQMRTEEVLTRFGRRTDDDMARLASAQENTQEALAHTQDTLARFASRTDEGMAHLARAQASTEEALRAFITNTDEKLSALINTVDRVANERGNGKE
ncbi:MAG TPA: hypothetical protein VM936_08740 [Pyrinomonadaceae bacterium]|jgi:ABC-type transporter Mla subunit MlaD|nr:hypothetical protein [Pyrinomonadaceae bacterium]